MKSYENMSKKIGGGSFANIEFMPSKSYIYEQKKYENQVNNKCDRLKMF